MAQMDQAWEELKTTVRAGQEALGNQLNTRPDIAPLFSSPGIRPDQVDGKRSLAVLLRLTESGAALGEADLRARLETFLDDVRGPIDESPAACFRGAFQSAPVVVELFVTPTYTAFGSEPENASIENAGTAGEIVAAVRLSESAARILGCAEAVNFRFPDSGALPSGEFELRSVGAGAYEVANEALGLAASFSSDGRLTVAKYAGRADEVLPILSAAFSTYERWTAAPSQDQASSTALPPMPQREADMRQKQEAVDQFMDAWKTFHASDCDVEAGIIHLMALDPNKPTLIAIFADVEKAAAPYKVKISQGLIAGMGVAES